MAFENPSRTPPPPYYDWSHGLWRDGSVRTPVLRWIAECQSARTSRGRRAQERAVKREKKGKSSGFPLSHIMTHRWSLFLIHYHGDKSKWTTPPLTSGSRWGFFQLLIIFLLWLLPSLTEDSCEGNNETWRWTFPAASIPQTSTWRSDRVYWLVKSCDTAPTAKYLVGTRQKQNKQKKNQQRKSFVQ